MFIKVKRKGNEKYTLKNTSGHCRDVKIIKKQEVASLERKSGKILIRKRKSNKCDHGNVEMVTGGGSYDGKNGQK